MATYLYKAKNGTETIRGEVEADSENAAIQSIEKMGYIPIAVGSKKNSAFSGRTPSGGRAPGKVPAKEIRAFTSQLAGLMRSKVTLMKALDILWRESRHPGLKDLLEKIRDEVKNGKKLSEAMSAHPRSFSRIYLNLVTAGEKAGILGETLDSIAQFDKKEDETRSKLRSAFAYPLFMLVVGLGTVTVMITFVVPKLTALYGQMGQRLPLPTRLLIAASRFLGSWGIGIAAVLTAAVLIAARTGFFNRYRPVFDALVLRLPLLGDFFVRSEIARFCRTLSLLLARSIPIPEAINASVPTLDNRALKASLSALSSDVASGGLLSKSLSRVKYFPSLVVSLIGVGEESGNLHQALADVAQGFEKDLDERLRIMSSLIEPALILGMGSIVGFIVMAMLLPIFELNFGS